MKKIPLLFFIISIIIPCAVVAGNGNNDSALHTKVTQWMNNANGIRFLENKGQMMDQQHKPVPNVLYEASGSGMDVYVTTSGLSYVFVKLKKHPKKNGSPIQLKFKQHNDNDSITETYCRADMQLVGASIKKENIIQEGESTDQSNYYYGDICPNGILGVHSYEKVTIKNIYPGIDWVLHGGKKGLKYDFVVHPGANPSQIKLKYKWTDKPQLQEDGSVKISAPMGNITEGTPISYCNDKQVPTTYIVKDSEIHFNVSDYNSAQTLIIDPTLVWATYYAGYEPNEMDQVFSMQDDGTNVWLTGGTASTNFPTLNPGGGAYFQGTLTAQGNIFILQFNTAGVLKWATYYGGGGRNRVGGEGGTGIYSDGANVWVTGFTYSTNFPTLNPGGGAYYQGTIGSNSLIYNAFILQFSTSGVRKWATYYGGKGFTRAYSINSDKTNIWITGQTADSTLPVLNPGGGAYFQGALQGTESTFILQFNTSGVRKWATYYGGSGDYYAGGNSIYSDGKNVWITGQTASPNFPTYNPGGGAYYQGTYAETYILKFNTAGVRKWATFYGGSAGDEAYSINSDGKNVWVTGYTGSPDFPVLNPGGGAYFQGAQVGIEDAFILQFDTAGIRKWATYYGGNGNENGSRGTSINSDGKNVWVTGLNFSAYFPTYNPGCGYYEDTLNVSSLDTMNAAHIFILQFNTSGVRKWATFYGYSSSDQTDNYIWSDGTNLFITGGAIGGNHYPTVNPGGGAYYDDTIIGLLFPLNYTFIGKFRIAASVTVKPIDSICRGGSTTLHASGAIYYNWSPPMGLSATNIPNPVASPIITTVYTVTGADTGGCLGTYTDSVKVIVDTFAFRYITISKDTSVCPGSSVTLDANDGTNYTWSTGATTSSISITDASSTKTYSVIISDRACIKDTSVTVTVVPLKVMLSGNEIVCIGDTVQLTVSGGTSYKWSNGNTNNTYYTGPILADSTITVTSYNSLGCSHDTTVIVSAVPRPVPVITGLRKVCAGEPDTLTASGGATYLWSNGNITKTCYIASVEHDTTIKITAYNSAYCSHDTTITIMPDIPNLNACCNTTIILGKDTTLVASGNTTKPYVWSPQVTCLNPSCDSVKVSPTVTTTYTVTMTDSMGCQVEKILTIDVELPCSYLIVPNVFTPNYAGTLGLDNIFYIQTSSLLTSWSIIIYDRWGKEVFSTTNPAQYWDGTTENGGKAPDGVYYYIINASCQSNSFKKDGFVQLIR